MKTLKVGQNLVILAFVAIQSGATLAQQRPVSLANDCTEATATALSLSTDTSPAALRRVV